ncbi:hypothetical protein F5Y16DRAFT_418026 [Xylariaceae sp. FL0255]|nr:hypothetical protein F5Y16DRAFT_418026 [Xylariaceae sp. FL0255]
MGDSSSPMHISNTTTGPLMSRPTQKRPSRAAEIHEIHKDANLTIKVREKDPLDPNKLEIDEQVFRVDREILIAASPVFKAMLTGGFAEADNSEIALIEDTGVNCKALHVMFAGLYSKHLFDTRPPEQKIGKDEVLYKITPVHLIELMEYAPECYYRSQSVIIDAQNLRWWLDHFSEKTSDGVRTMLPYTPIYLSTEKLATTLQRMDEMLFPGYMLYSDLDDYDEFDCHYENWSIAKADIQGIAKLEGDLIKAHGSATANDRCVITRFELIRILIDEYRWHAYPILVTMDRDYLDVARDFVKHQKLPEFWEPRSHSDTHMASEDSDPSQAPEQHPQPATHFFLIMKEIEKFIWRYAQKTEGRIDHSALVNMTRQLWQRNFPYEGVGGLESYDSLREEIRDMKKNTPPPRKLGFEVLASLLAALDKYMIPSSTLSSWFSIWFRSNWGKLRNSLSTATPDAGNQRLGELLMVAQAAYKFDNTFAFSEVTSAIDRFSCPRQALLDPQFGQIVKLYPALRDVILPDDRIIECLHRQTIDTVNNPDNKAGLCLDCFNASTYFSSKDSDTETMSVHLQQWARKNVLSFVKRMANTVHQNLKYDEHWRHKLDLLHNSWAGGPPPPLFGCRCDHGQWHNDKWVRSWVTANTHPGFTKHQMNIHREARRQRWITLAKDPYWTTGKGYNEASFPDPKPVPVVDEVEE